MDNEPKKPSEEPTEEDLQELQNLLKAIEKMEKEKHDKKNAPKKKPRNIIQIEFGGVFHRNPYVNFLFNYILNATLAYVLIELFDFASYSNIYIILLWIFIYTVIESIVRIYILLNHFRIVIKSFGIIFFFIYLFTFYVLDTYVFINEMSFVNEVFIVLFVLLFGGIRYIISISIRQNFRRRNLR